MKTAPEIPAEIVKRIEAPEYGKKAPALAFYAKPDLQIVYPYSADFDSDARVRAERIIASTERFQQGAIASFLPRPTTGRSMFSRATTTFFTNEAAVARLMRAFLVSIGR